MQPLLDKLSDLRDQEAMGLTPYGLQEVEKQIDALNPEYDELEDKVLSLQNRLETARMNPESTAEVQKLNGELQLANEKLERLTGEAAQTQEQLDAAGKATEKATASKNGGTGCRKYLGCCPEWMQKSAELSADLPRPNAGLIAAVQVRETYPGM